MFLILIHIRLFRILFLTSAIILYLHYFFIYFQIEFCNFIAIIRVSMAHSNINSFMHYMVPNIVLVLFVVRHDIVRGMYKQGAGTLRLSTLVNYINEQ